MTEKTKTKITACNIERQDLEQVYREMREFEYAQAEIREFSEPFCKASLVAVHLSSGDRWETLRKRLSSNLAWDNENHEQYCYSSPLQTETNLTDDNSPGPSKKQTLLEEISLQDVNIGSCYPGLAVYGTLCVEPFCSVGDFTTDEARVTVINSLLQDKFQRLVRIVINLGPADIFLKSAKVAQAISRYPRGSMIGVENPKIITCGWDNSLVMFIDNPEKIHFLMNPAIIPTLNGDKLVAEDVFTQEAEGKLDKAKALFEAQHWFGAVHVYTECIDGYMQLVEASQILLRGRSESLDQLQAKELMWLALMGRCATWLQVKKYWRALSDANKALQLEPEIMNQSLESDKPKVHFMKGIALLSIHRFHEAADAFNVALRYNPEDKSVQQALERSKLCRNLDSVSPSVGGKTIPWYHLAVIADFQGLTDGCAGKQTQHLSLDLSEYFLSDETAPPPIFASCVGPVEVLSREGAGRGLFLTESVVAGQLLLISEALALVSRNPKQIESYESVLPIIGQDLQSSDRCDMSLDIQEELITQLARKMLSSKTLVRQVSSLSDGRKDETREIPDMKMFLSGHGDDTAKEEGFSDGDDDENETVNIKILREIVAQNASYEHDSDEAVPSWGIWCLPSFINHSCHPNSHKIRIGDFLLIYASQDMIAGTEITLPYFDVFRWNSLRRLDYTSFGFVCKCNRCRFEESLPCFYDNLIEKVVRLLEMSIFEEDDYYTVFELARLAERLEQQMSKYRYKEEEKNWIRASIIDPYIACTRLSNLELQTLHSANPDISRTSRMSLLVDAFTAVDVGHKFGRMYAGHLIHEVGHDYGWGSTDHLKQELRAMKLYRSYYGNTIDTDTLRQLIAKVRRQI